MIIFDPVLLLAKISQIANVGRALIEPSELLQLQLGLFWSKVRIVPCEVGGKTSTQDFPENRTLF